LQDRVVLTRNSFRVRLRIYVLKHYQKYKSFIDRSIITFEYPCEILAQFSYWIKNYLIFSCSHWF